MALDYIDKPQVGGLSFVEIAPAEAIKEMPSLNTTQVPEMLLELKSGYSWLRVPAVLDSFEYQEPENISAQGISYAKEIKCRVANDALAMLDDLRSYLFKDLVVRYKDRLGNFRLVSNPEEPLRLKSDFATAKIGGQIGYSITFSGTHRRRAHFLTLPELPQFYINVDGELIYEGDLNESFNLNSDGELEVTGDFEHRYSIDHKARLIYT